MEITDRIILVVIGTLIILLGFLFFFGFKIHTDLNRLTNFILNNIETSSSNHVEPITPIKPIESIQLEDNTDDVEIEYEEQIIEVDEDGNEIVDCS